MDPKATGKFITLLRKEKGMTQKQLSEKLNISNKTISRWETGRGYPDIESLLALSSEFSVSINELLCGHHIDSPVMVQNAEKDIADAFIKTTKKKQHIRRLAICLAIILAFSTLFCSLTFITIYRDVIGSPTCVIASDYSYLTLFGERYVPLVLDNTECKVSERLINEVQVEGAPFIGKLLFGESIYSVKQCANNEIIYLQTEYDLILSNFYCKESKVKEYLKISKETAYDQFTAEILTENWNMYDLKLDDTLSPIFTNATTKVVSNVNCNWSRIKGDESIIIHSYQTEGPFRRAEGELIRKQGEYYWFDYDDIPATQDNENYSGIKAYEIDNSYDKPLNTLFSYMFK